MGDNNITKLIDKMLRHIDSFRETPLSKNKIKISKDDLLDFLDDLRQALPDELEEAEKITNAKNEILKAAKNKAAKIEADAEEKLREMLKEDEVVIAAEKEAEFIIGDAEKQADDIIKEAEEMAEQIKLGALSYAEEMLAAVEKMLSHNLETTISNSTSVIDTLKNNLDIIQNNRGELNAQILEAREVNHYEEGLEEEDTSEESDEEFRVNVNSDDFEDEEEDLASDDDDKALDEEEDEYEDDELYDFTKKFSFKKRGK